MKLNGINGGREDRRKEANSKILQNMKKLAKQHEDKDPKLKFGRTRS